MWVFTNAPTTGNNPSADEDGDGVCNGVEFVLGGDKNTNDIGKLPVPSADGTNMTFAFKRDQNSIDPSVALMIEVSGDLVTWNTSPSPYTVPDNETAGPPVAVDKDNPSGFDSVTLTVPKNAERKFARLKVVITP
jgi:hypothetical protein